MSSVKCPLLNSEQIRLQQSKIGRQFKQKKQTWVKRWSHAERVCAKAAISRDEAESVSPNAQTTLLFYISCLLNLLTHQHTHQERKNCDQTFSFNQS